jgi:hypothetical protein
MGGRINVKADDVFEFLGELRVVRQLERADAMLRELVGIEDTLHRAQAHPCGLRQHPASGLLLPAAARAPGRPLSARCRSAAVACRACAACRASALRRPPPRTAPAISRPLRFARTAHDLGGSAAFGSGQNDVGPPHVLLRSAATGKIARQRQTKAGAPIWNRIRIRDWLCRQSANALHD